MMQAPIAPSERPRAPCGREIIGVRALLEWAFGTECASLDYDEIGATAAPQPSSVSPTWMICQQLMLGDAPGVGVRVDTSFGRSLPHDDADVVAAMVRARLSWSMAIRVAELARAGRTPEWDLGPQRLVPVGWVASRHGRTGRTAVCQEVTYRSRRGLVTRKELWVPCELSPSGARIAAARRGWLDWWGALLEVQAGLQGVDLQRFVLSDRLPPMTPWKKSA